MFTKKRSFICLLMALLVVVSAVGLYTAPTSQAARLQEKGGQDQFNALLAPPLGSFVHIWVDSNVNNRTPAVAYNSKHDEYLVVWENDRGATKDIYARRVASDGTLKSSFTIISTINKWNWQPDVVYNPAEDEYFVVYTYNRTSWDYNIKAKRIKWDGSWVSAEIGINAMADRQWAPTVAYNSQDNEYLVVNENYESSTAREIVAFRIAVDGSFLGLHTVAAAANTIYRYPDVAYNAARNEYLIAYTYQHSVTNGNILGKICSADMDTIGSEIKIIDNGNDQDSVALTAGDDEYFAVWSDSTSTHDMIYGRWLGGTGTMDHFTTIANHSGKNDVEPDVAFSPIYGYVVVWRHIPSGSNWDVYGRFVETGQDSAAGGEFAIDDMGRSNQKSPAAACADSGHCLVVEEDNWNSPSSSETDYEIRGRVIKTHMAFLPMVVR